MKVKKSKKLKQKIKKVKIASDNSNTSLVEIITTVSNPYYKTENFSINLDGFDIHKDLLDPNSQVWLTNFQIAYPMFLISNQFPHLNILFRSCNWNIDGHFTKFHLMYNTSEPIIKENTFIICNAMKNHWVLLTNYKNDFNTWRFYDSIGSSSYLDSVVPFFKCLSEIVSTDKLIVDSMNIQSQKGVSDCGLFALANLVALCNGLDPCELKFNQNKMRAHYNLSIENLKFEMFNNESKSCRKKVRETRIFNCNQLDFN